MALKHKCPSCGDMTIQIVDHEFRIKGVMILWRICESCGHKWREVYNLSFFQRLSWIKPPHNNEDDLFEEETDG